jgi:hypothetical protein
VLTVIPMLTLLGCPGTFDISKYVVADTSTDEITSDATESVGESESASSESTSTSDTDTSESESESDDTDVTCEPGELDIGSACIGVVQTYVTGGYVPSDIAVADLTHDGLLDLLIAGTTVTLRTGNGGLMFSNPIVLRDATATALAVADVDDDNQADFAALTGDQLVIFTSNGGGSFSFSPPVPGVSGFEAEFVDIEGDTEPDLLISGPSLRVLRNDGATFVQVAEHFYSGLGLAVGRMTADDRDDVALAVPLGSFVAVFENDNGLLLDPLQPSVPTVVGVAITDVDGDDLEDVLAIDAANDRLVVLAVQPGLVIDELEEHPIGQGAKAVAVGDIDGDGIDDAAVANSESHDVSLLLGTGSGLTDEFRTLNPDPGDAPESIVIADLDGDGFAEIIVGMQVSNRVIIYGKPLNP